MTNPPTVSYADPSGTGAPSRSRTSSGRHSPGTVQVPSGPARPVVRARSCSSLTSPTISSMTSSRVTTPDVPPYSSTTTASWLPASRSISSSGSSRIVSGTRVASIIRAVTGTSSRRSCGTAIARLTWTSPSTSSQSSPITGKREWPVRRASRSTSPAEAVRSIAGAAHPGAHHVGGGALAEVAASGSRAARCPRRGCPPRPTAGPARRAPAGSGHRTAPPAG